MRALIWHGKHDIRCDTVADPTIEHPRDAIIKMSACAICGSDLHLFDGFMPTMESGDIMGHEFMGEVVEVGSANKALKVGDRIVVPFTIACGECDQCKRSNFSVCERSNRNRPTQEKLFGHGTAGLFGYSHLTGGYSGGQAEYVRVPFADTTHIKVPIISATSRCSFWAIFSRPAGRPQCNAISNPPIPWRSGALARWGR